MATSRRHLLFTLPWAITLLLLKARWHEPAVGLIDRPVLGLVHMPASCNTFSSFGSTRKVCCNRTCLRHLGYFCSHRCFFFSAFLFVWAI
uniref:Putative secreted protein n=1 Tax=Ixodes ricinus TaxID=34613 RepID=A0A6B0UAR6_IXORI